MICNDLNRISVFSVFTPLEGLISFGCQVWLRMPQQISKTISYNPYLPPGHNNMLKNLMTSRLFPIFHN